MSLFRLLWGGVGLLTLVAAGGAVGRILHWRPARIIIGALVPAMIVGLAYTAPVAVGDSRPSGLIAFGDKNVAIHWPAPPKGSKVVYLTFDDGPDPESTPYILSVLLAYHVPAAFFDIGKNIEREPGAALVKEEVQDGMVVGDHSWSHPHFPTISNAEAQSQILRTANLIQQITGVRPKYFRYPYGQRTNYVESHLSQWGFDHSVYWDDAGMDWFPLCPGATNIINTLVVNNPNLHDGSVLLLHDSSECGYQQLSYLPRLITQLRSMGYTFGIFGQGTYPSTPAVAGAGD